MDREWTSPSRLYFSDYITSSLNRVDLPHVYWRRSNFIAQITIIFRPYYASSSEDSINYINEYCLSSSIYRLV